MSPYAFSWSALSIPCIGDFQSDSERVLYVHLFYLSYTTYLYNFLRFLEAAMKKMLRMRSS